MKECDSLPLGVGFLKIQLLYLNNFSTKVRYQSIHPNYKSTVFRLTYFMGDCDPMAFFYLHGMGGMLHIVWTYIDWHASRRSLRQMIVWLYTCMCRGPLQWYTATLCTFDLCIVHHRPALCTIVNKGVTLHHVALYWLGGAQDDFSCTLWTTTLTMMLSVWMY